MAYIFLSVGLSLPTFATLYMGTIKQTVTFTNSPAYQVGQTFFGSYQYESPSIDGDFGTLKYKTFTNPSSLPTLGGYVYSFIVDPARVEFDDHQFSVHNHETHLTVHDGRVTDFHRVARAGFTTVGFSLTQFNAVYSQFFYNTQGTMAFTDPVAVPEPSTTAAAMVGLMVIGIALRYRRRAKHKADGRE